MNRRNQILAGLLAAALAAWFIYRRNKARSGTQGGGAAPDTRSPYQKASDALTELSASGIWEKGGIKEFYSRLSDIFRNYLDAQFGLKAELMTTNHITRELRRTGADIKTVIKTRELLENTDLVKFAKFKPGDKERDAAVSGLKELLVFFTQQEENRRALANAALLPPERAAGTPAIAQKPGPGPGPKPPPPNLKSGAKPAASGGTKP